MVYKNIIQRYDLRSPYAMPELHMPNFWQRIDAQLMMKKNIIIAVDGKPRSGKSYFGKHLCEHYAGKGYITIFTLSGLISLLKSGFNNGWVLFDEIEMEAPSTEYKSTPNLVLKLIMSSYGYKNIQLVMTTPSISFVDASLRHLLTFRVSVGCYANKEKIVRKAYVKLPYFNEMKNKWSWNCVEEYTIPQIPVDGEYETAKHGNFTAQLDLLENRLSSHHHDAESDVYRLRKLKAQAERREIQTESARLRLQHQQQS